MFAFKLFSLFKIYRERYINGLKDRWTFSSFSFVFPLLAKNVPPPPPLSSSPAATSHYSKNKDSDYYTLLSQPLTLLSLLYLTDKQKD